MSAAVRRPEPGADDRPRILVVDDIPMFRELEQVFLSRVGEVRTAATAEDAVAIAAEQRPAVVVLDIDLPDLPGDQAAARIREAAGHDCAIVMVTSGRAGEHARAVRAGAQDVLCKPLSRVALVETVRRFLQGPTPAEGLPRVSHVAPIRLLGREQQLEGTIRNLSRGGLFIEADWLPPEGTELRVAFHLPGHRAELAPTARVVWRRIHAGAGRSGVGVRFVELDGDSVRELDDFVYEQAAAHAPRPGATR